MRPFLSIVIPTYNRAELLASCLESVVAQDYPHDRYEVVVVDDGSTDGTPEVAKGFAGREGGPEVRIERAPHRGLNPARNIGLRSAAGALVCFIDDDVVTPPAWLSAMARGLAEHPEAACFGGPILLRIEGRLPRSCGRELVGETELGFGDAVIDAPTLYGANFAVTPAAVDLVGMFNEALPNSGDEEEWLHRLREAGGRILYLPGATVWHRRRPQELRLRFLLRKRFDRGRGEAVYMAVMGSPLRVRSEALQIVRSLGHSVRRRCAYGLLPIATSLGRVMALVKDRP